MSNFSEYAEPETSSLDTRNDEKDDKVCELVEDAVNNSDSIFDEIDTYITYYCENHGLDSRDFEFTINIARKQEDVI